MNNAERILRALDLRLSAPVRLTLYGRAALQLGCSPPPPDVFRSMDVDAVLETGEAEHLLETSNFWQALEDANRELAPDGLYISHLFEETQVVLTPEWRTQRQLISLPFQHLTLARLGDGDLLLSKLMRDDAADRQDALFIFRAAGFSVLDLNCLIRRACLPDIPELAEAFAVASQKLLRLVSA